MSLKNLWGETLFKSGIVLSLFSGVYGIISFNVHSFGLFESFLYYLFYVNFYDKLDRYGENSRIISWCFLCFSIAVIFINLVWQSSQIREWQKLAGAISLLLISASCVIKTNL